MPVGLLTGRNPAAIDSRGRPNYLPSSIRRHNNATAVRVNYHLGTIGQCSNGYVSHAAPCRRLSRPGNTTHIHVGHIRPFRRLLNFGCCAFVVLLVGRIFLPGGRFLFGGSLWLFDHLFLGGDRTVFLWGFGLLRRWGRSRSLVPGGSALSCRSSDLLNGWRLNSC